MLPERRAEAHAGATATAETPVAELRPDPRYNQRMRTREELLRAARELVKAGTTRRVPEAADAALVSRATAYRYFPTQAALLVEASMLPGLPTADSLFSVPPAPTDVADRAALVSDVMFRHISSVEREFRLLLREQLLRSSATSNRGAGQAFAIASTAVVTSGDPFTDATAITVTAWPATTSEPPVPQPNRPRPSVRPVRDLHVHDHRTRTVRTPHSGHHCRHRCRRRRRT